MNIQPFLNQHTEALTLELSHFLQQEFPEEIRCIQVMVFRESLPSVPFYMYFLNRFQGSAEGIKPYEPMSKLGLLIDSPEYISQEDTICDCLDLDDDEQDSCMENAYERYNADNLLTAEWFAQCWQKAGGKDFQIPAFLTEEDGEFRPINLKTGKHIKHSSEYSNVFDG